MSKYVSGINRILEDLWFVWLPLLAAWGGIMRALNVTAPEKLTTRQRLAVLAIRGATSAFAGLVTGLACRASDVEFYTMSVLISLSGWLGPEALSLLSLKYKSKLDG